jgi:hypothetical protein
MKWCVSDELVNIALTACLAAWIGETAWIEAHRGFGVLDTHKNKIYKTHSTWEHADNSLSPKELSCQKCLL